MVILYSAFFGFAQECARFFSAARLFHDGKEKVVISAELQNVMLFWRKYLVENFPKLYRSTLAETSILARVERLPIPNSSVRFGEKFWPRAFPPKTTSCSNLVYPIRRCRENERREND